MQTSDGNRDALFPLGEANALVLKANTRQAQCRLEISQIQRTIDSLGVELRNMRDQFLLPALRTETTYLLDDDAVQHSLHRAELRLNGLASWFADAETTNQFLQQSTTEILGKYQGIAELVSKAITMLPTESVIPFAELGIHCANAAQESRALLSLITAQKQDLLATAELVAAVLAAITAIREGDVPRSAVVEMLNHLGRGERRRSQ
ncbi:MAG TPA: hypothetical protein VIM95_00665 [Chitinimonas sp.]